MPSSPAKESKGLRVPVTRATPHERAHEHTYAAHTEAQKGSRYSNMCHFVLAPLRRLMVLRREVLTNPEFDGIPKYAPTLYILRITYQVYKRSRWKEDFPE